MPVKSRKSASEQSAAIPKTKKTAASFVAEAPNKSASHDCCFTEACSMPFVQQEAGSMFGRKILFTLLGILLAYGIVFVGTLIRNNVEEYRYIGKAEKQERTITVEAEGKVTAKPDIAVTSMGMTVEAETVVAAQEKNSETMNVLIAKLKELGISEDDIQTTDYNIFPQYNYTEDAGRELRGYQVSQNVQVKIRAVDTANAVLALAGEVGANNVSGLDFTLDDKEVYVNQAREEAIKKLREKADILGEMLGVRVVGVVSYDEFEAGGYDQGYPLVREAYALGGNGGSSPQIESGSTDIVMNIRAVLEIK